MALVDLPGIRLPKGALFYVTAFLVVFYFFFTETKIESSTGTTPSQSSVL